MKTERSTPEERREIIEFLDVKSSDLESETFSPEECSALETIHQRVAGGKTLYVVVTEVFEANQEVFPCDRMSLSFLEENDSRMVARWVRARYEPVFLGKGYAEDIDHSSLASVCDETKVRIINDLSRYLDTKPMSASGQLLVQEGVQSSITCPLIVDGRPVGFLFRSSRAPRAFDRHQALLQAALLKRMGWAVERAYRHEQLEAARQAYRELVAFVGHEVKSPVASISMDTRVLLGGYLGELSADQACKIQAIMFKAEHVLQLARDYLDLSRVDTISADPHFHETEDFAKEILEPAIELGASGLEERKMRLTCFFPSSVFRVSCEPELLRIAVANLLSNAVKYGAEGGEIRLEVERVEAGIRIAVRNEGAGFPASERSRLFRRFSRLHTPETKQQSGTGIGLYTVWRIARVHGGSVQAESEEGRWAEFTIRIPQPPGDATKENLEILLSC